MVVEGKEVADEPLPGPEPFCREGLIRPQNLEKERKRKERLVLELNSRAELNIRIPIMGMTARNLRR